MDNRCQHYQRKCALLTPCCDKEYKCRVCHDEAEGHVLDRRKVENIVCLQCGKQQLVNQHCIDCGILFGKYSCLICRLFDDVDKKQYHCNDCGMCRVGGRDNFFHCTKCGLCLPKSIKDTHKCLENVSRKNCAVCLEDLHTSRMSCHVPSCGHLIHRKCFEGMLQHGQSSCPTCNESLVDMSSHWEHLDRIISETPMPELYKEYHVNILCRDCHKESKVVFHVIGLKCQTCGGYNTTRIGGDDPLPEEALGDMTELSVASGHEDSWETVSVEESDAIERLDSEECETSEQVEETITRNESDPSNNS